MTVSHDPKVLLSLSFSYIFHHRLVHSAFDPWGGNAGVAKPFIDFYSQKLFGCALLVIFVYLYSTDLQA